MLGADFNYAKYSSRCRTCWLGRRQMSFQIVLLVEHLWIGIYPLCCYSPLWKAQDATFQAQQLDNSIDLNGDGILFYPNFQVHIKAGKTSLPIFLVRFTHQMELTLSTIGMFCSAILLTTKEIKSSSLIQQAPHTMTEEVAAFAQMIQQPDQTLYQNWLMMQTSSWATLYHAPDCWV